MKTEPDYIVRYRKEHLVEVFNQNIFFSSSHLIKRGYSVEFQPFDPSNCDKYVITFSNDICELSLHKKPKYFRCEYPNFGGVIMSLEKEDGSSQSTFLEKLVEASCSFYDWANKLPYSYNRLITISIPSNVDLNIFKQDIAKGLLLTGGRVIEEKSKKTLYYNICGSGQAFKKLPLMLDEFQKRYPTAVTYFSGI